MTRAIAVMILVIGGSMVLNDLWPLQSSSAQTFPPPPEECDDTEHISLEDAAHYAVDAGFTGEDAVTIVAIAWAESKQGDRFECNYNPPTEISLGILQLNALAHDAVAEDPDIAFTPGRAFEFAHDLFLSRQAREQEGFEDWSVFTTDISRRSYRRFLYRACQEVARLGEEVDRLCVWPIDPEDRQFDEDGAGVLQDYANFNANPKAPNQHHTGPDIFAAGGTPVVAAGTGEVVMIQENDVGCDPDQGGACADHGYGNTVIIEHNIGGRTIYSHYSHLASIVPRLKEDCGSPDEPEPIEETLTRRTCSQSVSVDAGETIGTVGATCYGFDCTVNHLHYEVKEFATLGTLNDDAGDFGYTQEHPDQEGYEDPIHEFHYTSPIAPTRVEVTPEGETARIRIGPGEYRTLLGASGSAEAGQEFIAFASSPGTTDTRDGTNDHPDPRCSEGWYQIRLPEGGHFNDFNSEPGSIPEAWMCKGNYDHEQERVITWLAEVSSPEPNPAIEIAKTPDTQEVIAGSSAGFTITVVNTGEVRLSDVQITDEVTPDCSRFVGDLASDQEVIYSCDAANVTTGFTNTASVTGTSSSGEEVSAIDSATVEVTPSSAADAIRPAFDENTFGANDDGTYGEDEEGNQTCIGQDGGIPFSCESTRVSLGFTINFFGQEYDSVYINNNGNLTFDDPLPTFTPFPLQGTERVIIAPYFADVDTRAGNGVSFGQGTVGDRPAFGVTWPGVGCYSQNTQVLNFFQVILVDRSDRGVGDFDIEFNYDQVEWETGQASGGDSLCEGGSSSRVGYSNGTDTSFELPGSGESGTFLDSNAETGLVHNSRNSVQSGRYVFPVRNGIAPTGGEIFGNVSTNPVLADAPIQVCDSEGFCNTTFTNSSGNYSISGLLPGDYEVTAFSPANFNLKSEAQTVNLALNEQREVNFVLTGPTPTPAGTSITNRGTGDGGEPIIHWNDELSLSTTGCTGGTATYQIVLDGAVIRSGPMTETSSGSYVATIEPLFPDHGHGQVIIEIDCPDGPDEGVDFDIYIDPSGVVQDQSGNPIAGATVTLLRSDSPGGPFDVVADGSAIMSPTNRHNPDTTDVDGLFGWDVISGFYVVRAEAENCTSEQSEVLTIPPPVTGLVLTLECEAPNTPPSTDANGPYSGEEGSPITIVAGGSSDPDGDALTYSFDCTDDGAFEVEDQAESSFDCSYEDNGEFTARVRVEDTGGLADEATAQVTINNAASDVDAGADQTVIQGDEVTIEAAFSDPGVNDAPWSFTIDWGDGQSDSGETGDQSRPVTAGHAYGEAGEYTVQVCITDKDGGQGCDSLTVTVASPAINIEKGPETQEVESGGTASFTITVTNPGTVAVSGVAVADPLAPDCGREVGALEPGQSAEYSCALEGVTETFTNEATATGVSSTGGEVSDTDTAEVTVAEPQPEASCDDLLLSLYRTSPGDGQLVDVTNVGDAPIAVDGCSLVTYDAVTEESLGDATVALSGALDPGETFRVGSEGVSGVDAVVPDGALPAGPGGLAVLDAAPPAGGTPVQEVLPDNVTGLVYRDSNEVFGVSHLRVPDHNAVYDCVYGGSGQGSFEAPFTPVAQCLDGE